MPITPETINVEITPKGNRPVLYFSQYDNGRPFVCNLLWEGEAYEPTDIDVELHVRKVDGNIVSITPDSVSTNAVAFSTTEQLCACFGKNIGELVLKDGDDVIATKDIDIIIQRDVFQGGIDSASEIANLTTQITQITTEVIGNDYYNKTEVDGLLDDKADISDLPDMSNYYTKTATDNLLNNKADISDLPDMSNYYTKTATDNLLNNKADISDLPDMSNYYTKTATDNLLNNKANISDLPDMSNYYTKTATDNQIAALIDDAQTANNKAWSSHKISDELYALLPVGTASGAIASFNTALAKPLVSCVVDENATKLYQRGINLWDEQWEVGDISAETGLPGTGSDRIRSKNYCPCKPSTAYYLVIPNKNLRFYFYDNNFNYLGFEGWWDYGRSFTTPNNAYYFKIGGSGAYGTIYNNDIGINYPSSDTTYHAYNGIDHDLPLSEMPSTYQGDNNFFADVGDVSLTYKDTIQHYIDDNIASLQALILSI